MANKIIQSIDRSLQIMELFTTDKHEWGVTEISKELNFYKSTVYNILSTLEQRNFIKKDPITEKYHLGVKFLILGNTVHEQLDVKKEALPYIEKLSKKFGETVHLGILDDNEVLSIDQEESTQSLRAHVSMGERAPLHCTAVGKAIMAYLPEENINNIIEEKGLKKYTERTITSKDKLDDELKEIRKKGYAVDNIEHQEGIRCVAAPIYDYTGQVFASISVSGPASRIKNEIIPDIAVEVKKYCNIISEKMGYVQQSTEFK